MAIITERLILRKWQENDLKPFAQINSDPKVCQFLPKILSKEESDKLAQNIIEYFSKFGFGFFAAELKENQQFIGFIGLALVDFESHFSSLNNPLIEIGWRLNSNYWNKGYATEGAKAVLNFAFNELNSKEVVAFTARENLASRKVMEKIGMKYDKNDDFKHPKLKADHPLVDHVLYRMKI